MRHAAPDNSRMWRIALCLSWTPTCTLDDTIGGLRFIARGAEGEAMIRRWCSAMDISKDITCGVWILISSQCPPVHGPVTSIKVCITQFVTVNKGILKMSPMKKINLEKTHSGRALCGESHKTMLVSCVYKHNSLPKESSLLGMDPPTMIYTLWGVNLLDHPMLYTGRATP